MKPEFVDNRNGNTLVAALRGHLDWLAATYAQPVELSVATGYFNLGGFALIAEECLVTSPRSFQLAVDEVYLALDLLCLVGCQPRFHELVADEAKLVLEHGTFRIFPHVGIPNWRQET